VAGPIVLGVLRLTLHLPESGSLKSKRQVVSSLLQRVRSQYQVAAAEVGERDLWQIAQIAVACVSADSRHCDEVLARVLTFVESRGSAAQITDVATELLRL